jgi:hypothetical protein
LESASELPLSPEPVELEPNDISASNVVEPTPERPQAEQAEAAAADGSDVLPTDIQSFNGTDTSEAIADLTPDSESAMSRPQAQDTVVSKTESLDEPTPRATVETPSPTPSEAASSPVAEVKPSPAINSYEAKAILEELNELETEVEDLKGSIASAADQARSPDASSSQLESLRSQLEQLKAKFGDTWDRLSDFMRMKLQS